jgi:hypothetical protein
MLGVSLATLLTHLVEHATGGQTRLVSGAAVLAAQLLSYGLVWVGRFLILDRWLFKPVGDTPYRPTAEERSHLLVRMPIYRAMVRTIQTKPCKPSGNSMPDLKSSGKPQRPVTTIFKRSWFSRCARSFVAQKGGIKALFWAVVVNFILFGTFLFNATPMYETNDDRTMEQIASGFFTSHPDAHLFFTNILIGWVLKFLYGSWAGCNWYLIYLIAVHFAALTAIAFLVISRRGGWLFTLLYIGFFYVVETHILLHLQFTTTAFLAGTAGLLWLVDGVLPAHPVNWPKVIVGIFFFSLMCLIRQEVVPLFCAIAAPFLLERLGLREWKRVLGTALAGIGIFVSLNGVNNWAYQHDSAWAEFTEYNHARSKIHGTPLVQFIPQAAAAVGWTKNDGLMFSHFYFPDRDLYAGASKMQHLLDKLKTLQRDGAAPSVNEGFLNDRPTRPPLTRLLFLPNMYLTDSGDAGDSARLMNLAILNAIWCIFAAGVLRRRIATVLVINYVIFWVIGFYLLTTLRLPERVAYNFPLFIHAICLYWATGFRDLTAKLPDKANRFDCYAVKSWRPKVLRMAGLAFLSVWAIFYLFNVSMLAESLRSANNDHQYLRYYVSQIIFTPIRRLLPAGKTPLLIALPADSVLEQSLFFHPSREKVPFAMVPYGWPSQSPLFNQVLELHHLDPYSLSVVSRPDTYFLMTPMWIGQLKMLYYEHYGLQIRFDMVINTDDMPLFNDCHIYLYRARLDEGTSDRVTQ